MALQQGEPIAVNIAGYDDAEGDEYFSSGFEPLEDGWALVLVSDLITGASKDKKTPFAHLALKIKEGRRAYFTEKGEAKPTFTDIYLTEGMKRFVKGLFENAIGLSKPTSGLTTAYLRQAIGREFVTRLETEAATEKGPARQRLGEFHAPTPEWLGYVREDRDRAADAKPKRGKKPAKTGAGTTSGSMPQAIE